MKLKLTKLAICTLVLASALGLNAQTITVDNYYNQETKKAENGKTVAVHYEGSLDNGKVFDSSYPRKKPIEFRLGQGQVIEGWDEGIALLKVGDKARFVIPSHLGYGPSGAGGVIPPNANLIFDVELMDVK